MKRYMVVAAAALFAASASASESWVLFGSVLGYRNGCDPSYVWKTEPIFHNRSAADQIIAVLHRSGTFSLPGTLTIPAGTSLPLSLLAGGPQLGIGVIELDAPADVTVQPRLEYENILPCSGAAPALGPSGNIPLPLFHVVEAGQAQLHYGLDLGIQSVRVNVGVYNAGTRTATATIVLQRPSCNNPTSTSVTVPPDALIQVPIPVPPICSVPVNPSPPFLLNATVVVDQPSFSYATTVSNGQSPNVTFGAGMP